jgi:predicted nucleic acid-binding protein
VKFWDSSAILPLLVHEDGTHAALARLRDDPQLAVWWGTPVECASAIARLERDGAAADRVAEAFARLDDLAQAWIEVEPHDDIRAVARRLLRVHPLRAADALQLAAAYLVSEGRPATLEVLTLDERVRLAALKEGFVAHPADL